MNFALAELQVEGIGPRRLRRFWYFQLFTLGSSETKSNRTYDYGAKQYVRDKAFNQTNMEYRRRKYSESSERWENLDFASTRYGRVHEEGIRFGGSPEEFVKR